ncbi:MAG: response regulator transcription factor [Chitinophagaceae bacterium]|nr:response regulator transcription factor [Chitinophagaceae bacterium]
MIQALIIDDEKNAIEVLELQLSRYCKQVQVLATAQGGVQGIELIRKYQPDLVFLDIEMPHKNGFDVLNETKDCRYKVIFTTAYDQFAIRAFKFSAVDYLLKPIDIRELQEAVEKAAIKEEQGSLDEKLQVLISQLQAPVRQERIALPVGDGMQFFHTDEILRCESDSNYTHISLTNGKKITIAKTLKEVEESLRGVDFYRIHQSHLVNMNHISKVVKGEGGYVVMKDGTTITISRNKKEAFLESFRKI